MKILICGATGSIGKQSLEVIKLTDHEVVGFVFNKNEEVMKQILNNFPNVLVYSPINKEISNVKNLNELFEKSNPDIVLNAVTGFAGLQITLLSLYYKKNILLANKESLVVAGWYVMNYAKKHNLTILPIDSEHCSVFDILKNSNKKIKKIIITASGGPFYNLDSKELENVTFNDAINHPKWKMGYKISIDSATLMNKCFELIEAYFLFKNKNVKAVYHKETLVHGMVEFEDNSIFASLSNNDMKLPIAQAIANFENFKPVINSIDLNNLTLSFGEIDENKWLPIKWAYEVINNDNKTIPVILNRANEESIELFKEGKIKFNQIIEIISMCINKFYSYNVNTIKDVYILDSIIRKHVREWALCQDL